MALAADRTLGQRAVQAAVASLITALAVLEVLDRLGIARRRAAHQLTSWWADVERRQRMDLRRSQAEVLIRYGGRRGR
jgi:hypothetical protein